MEIKIKTNKGITLVSLVITIIVMLILAGVSLSMVTGDSSVLEQAQKTAFMQEMAGYKEELETQILGKSAEYYAKNLKHIDKSEIKLAGEYMREYIPSMKEEDLDDYMIVGGELYYVGDDEFEIGICAELGYETKPEGMTGEEFASQIESSMLEELVIAMAGQAFTNYNEEKGEDVEVGLKLARKTASSGFGQGVSHPWTIITEVVNGQNVSTYADGWYYVKAGESIPQLGVLKNSYIINYGTQRAVKFDSNKHVILSNEGNLAVTDGLVYNADPSNMSSGSTESWGSAKVSGFEGTEYNEDDTVKSGWTETAFVFDGENDYIQVAQPGDFSKGFTFEFYGNPTRFEYQNGNRSESCGGMFARVGEGNYLNSMRFGWLYSAVNVKLSGSTEHDIKRDKAGIAIGKDFYLTYVLEINGTTAKGKFYINGELKETDNVNYNSFMEGCASWNKDNAPFEIGRTHWYAKNNWYYYQGQCYAARVFTKSLSADEVKANYKATVSYHNILVNNGEADNDNTGGEDIGNLNK